MAPLRRVVLDCLKPHEPGVPAVARQLADLPGVTGVHIDVYEIDRAVENVKITIQGADVPLDRVTALIRELGGAVHSIDQVVAGRELIDAPPTFQD